VESIERAEVKCSRSRFHPEMNRNEETSSTLKT
jgi:hypothetical protein